MMQLNQIHHQKITERLKKNKVIPYYSGNEAFSEDEQAILRRYKRTGRKEDLKDSPILRYARLKKKIEEQRDTIEIDYEQSNVELYQGFNEFIHLANMLIESSRNDNELSEEVFRERDWLSFYLDDNRSAYYLNVVQSSRTRLEGVALSNERSVFCHSSRFPIITNKEFYNKNRKHSKGFKNTTIQLDKFTIIKRYQKKEVIPLLI